MLLYTSYLTGIEGGPKNKTTAQQEVTDLVKFLWHADNTQCVLENTLDLDHVITYLNLLRQKKIGPSGQISKLSIIIHIYLCEFSNCLYAVKERACSYMWIYFQCGE